MDIVDKLNSRFLTQSLVPQGDGLSVAELEKYKKIASGYAEMENAVAVLSDMHTNISYVYYGHFSHTLGWKQVPGTEDRIDSIWEEAILKQIHPDDLHEKYLQELRFFHFVRHQHPHGEPASAGDSAKTSGEEFHRGLSGGEGAGNDVNVFDCLY